ncbi:MAG: hypothetical protein ACRDSE_22240 [Pseudonocardiaceae bacterium]
MVSWADARRWTPEPLHQMVGDLNAEYNELIGISDELDASATPHGWSGEAASAATMLRQARGHRAGMGRRDRVGPPCGR